MIILSDLLQKHGKFPVKIEKVLVDKIERPTFGAWKDLMIGALNCLPMIKGHRSCFVTELPAYIEKILLPALGTGNGDYTKHIISLRNFLAHSGRVADDQAKALLQNHQEQFGELLLNLQFFNQYNLITKTAEERVISLNGLPTNGSFHEYKLLIPDILHKDRIFMVTGFETLDLFPLHAFTDVFQYQQDKLERIAVATPLIYFRLNKKGYLEFTALNGKEAFSHEKGSALVRFKELFQLEEWRHMEKAREKKHLIGFNELIADLSEIFVGRKNDIKYVKDCIKQHNAGILWVSGAPGVGKSSFMVKLINDFQGASHYVMIPYIFRNGRPDCSIDDFIESTLQYFQSVIQESIPIEPNRQDRRQQFFNALRIVKKKIKKKILFLIDGIDEVHRLESDLLSYFLKTIGSEVVCVCAGRPEALLEKMLKKQDAIWLFPNGLPKLDDEAIRAMLTAHLGRIKYDLFARDSNDNGLYRNEFIEVLVKKSDGLPLYIRMLIEDILTGKWTIDDENRLPNGLPAYFEQILGNLRVSSIGGVLTAIFSLLACSKEPITKSAVKSLLSDYHLRRTSNWETTFQESFEFGHMMLRRAATPDENEGWTFYHEGFREHLLSTEVVKPDIEWSQQTWLKYCIQILSENEDFSLAPYIFRKGIEHLLDDGKTVNAVGFLTNFDYLMRRLKVLPGTTGVLDVSSDWQRLQSVIKLDDNASIWEDFWRTKEHLLLRCNDNWPAYKIFLQLAWEHAKNSPLTLAAEAWILSGKCDWYWLRLKKIHRPDNLQKNACSKIIKGHNVGARTISIDPKGELILSGYEDGLIKLWDFKKGRWLKTFEGHTASVRACPFTQDSSRFVSVSYDGTVKIWDITESKCLKTLEIHDDWITCAAISPNGKYVITGSKDKTTRLWNLSTMEHMRIIGKHESEVMSVAWHPDNERILSGCASPDSKMRMWNIETGLCEQIFAGHRSSIRSADISFSGRMVVSGSYDQTIRIWNLKTGECLRVFGEPWPSLKGHTSWVRGVRFTPDEKQIVSVSNDKTVRIWNIETQQCESVFEGHVAGIRELAVSPDGQSAATCATHPDNSIRIWNINTPIVSRKEIGHLGNIYAYALSPDRFLVATGSGHPDHDVRVWSLKTGKCIVHLKGNGFWITSLAFSHDSSSLVSGTRDGQIRIWDLSTQTCIKQLKGLDNRILATIFSKDGEKIISGGYNESVFIWSRLTGEKMQVLEGHSDWIYALAVDHSGHYLAAGLGDGKIYIWEIDSGKQYKIMQAHKGPIRSVAFHPDSSVLYSIGVDDVVKNWDVISGVCTQKNSLELFSHHYPKNISLLQPDHSNDYFSSKINKIGIELNTTEPMHWCSEQVQSSFSGSSIAVLERVSSVYIIRLLEAVNGHKIVKPEQLRSGSNVEHRQSDSVQEIPRQSVIHAVVILGWVLENRDKVTDGLFVDVQRILNLSNEDREHTFQHIKSASVESRWANRIPELISRSIDRVEKAFAAGFFSQKSPLGRQLEQLMEDAALFIKRVE